MCKKMFIREINVTNNRKKYYPLKHFNMKIFCMTFVGSFDKPENKSFRMI